MKLPIDWLNDFVNCKDIEISEFAKKMTMTGTKVEQIIDYDQAKDKLVIGKILSLRPHPNADKLQILEVDVKISVKQIVTGAKNVFEGAMVVVALDGAKLANGIKIKKSKLRGEVSEGMLCSYEELGFNKNVIPKDAEDGVLILKGNYSIGDHFFKALGLSYPTVEFELTFNRPDCLSVLGLSYEAAVTFNRKRKFLNTYRDSYPSSVELDIDKDVCSAYFLLECEKVNIKPSPEWIQLRLMASGVRPVNNLVDLTNYVMLETGNPIHAFDHDDLNSRIIRVKRAKNDEKFITLDSQPRVLNSSDIVICDDDKSVALAGIMGGENSQVKETTTKTFIEVANFDKDVVRSTSSRLKLRTESSMRFEKGVDTYRTLVAVQRIIDLLDVFELNAKVVAVSSYIENFTNDYVELRPERVNEVLGTEISKEEIISIIKSLEIEVIEDDALKCKIPTFRKDLQIEQDLIEEVARIYGFDKIVSKIPKILAQAYMPSKLRFRNDIRDILWACGVDEMVNYSFVSEDSIKSLHIDKSPIELINPLGADYAKMRPSLLVSALDVLRYNERVFNEDVLYFEIGNVFYEEIEDYQRESLSLAGYGSNLDFFKFKGIIETLVQNMGFKGVEIRKNTTNKLFHTHRSADLLVGGEYIGTFGELSLYIKEELKLNHRCYLAEFDIDKLFECPRKITKYEKISKFPSITRDISIVVNEDITHSQIVEVMEKAGGNLLRNVEIFDTYRSQEIGENKKSVSYSMSFMSNEKTLTDEEIEPIYESIREALLNKLGAVRR